MTEERKEHSPTSIRPYKTEDYRLIREILEESELFYELMDGEQRFANKTIQNPGSIFVAEQNGRVVGCAMLVEDGWAPFGFRLAVKEEFRNQGIGSQLIAAVESEAKNRGYEEFHILVDEEDQELQEFYEKKGYEKGGNYRWLAKNLTQESSVQNSEQEQHSLPEFFKEHTYLAEYSIFQNSQITVKKGENENFLPTNQPVYGGAARSNGAIERQMYKLLGWREVENAINKRKNELLNIQRTNRIFPDEDPRRYMVGTSDLVIYESRSKELDRDVTTVIFFGCIATDSGHWRGGRARKDDYLRFIVDDNSAVERMLTELDLEAKAYDVGTEDNFYLIYKIMKEIFPEETMRRVAGGMFRRQEIAKLFDLRKKEN